MRTSLFVVLLTITISADATLIFRDSFEPTNVPTVQDTLADAGSASRFLGQTTFGPTDAEIDALVGQSSSAWFTQQVALPPSSYLDKVFELLQRPQQKIVTEF